MKMKFTTALGGTAFISAAIGTLAGYFYAQRQLKNQFEERVAQEVTEAREYWAMRYKDGDFATPASTLAALARREPGAELTDADIEIAENGRGEAMGTVQGVGRRPITVDDLERVVGGLKYGAPAQNSQAAKVRARRGDPAHIRVIDEEEYSLNESGYSQSVLTYFAEDDTLIYEDMTVVDNIRDLVGDTWRDKFGIRTSDENVVHVQNTTVDTEYEIHRSAGSYAKEVAGL